MVFSVSAFIFQTLELYICVMWMFFSVVSLSDVWHVKVGQFVPVISQIFSFAQCVRVCVCVTVSIVCRVREK